MLSKKKITHIRSLHHKKFRDRLGEFVVEGPKLVAELLQSNYHVLEIFAVEEQLNHILKHPAAGVKVTVVSPSELGRISHFKTPNDVLALVKQPAVALAELETEDDFVLMLDGIADPGNLGTIIRTADWFGIRNIICSSNCVELFNPKVVQATMGSLFRTKVFYTDLLKVLSEMNNEVPVYGTFLDGDNIYAEDFGESGIIVIGSESHGITPEVANYVTQRIHIPSVQRGAESLNASVAAAICCSEVRRNKLKNI